MSNNILCVSDLEWEKMGDKIPTVVTDRTKTGIDRVACVIEPTKEEIAVVSKNEVPQKERMPYPLGLDTRSFVFADCDWDALLLPCRGTAQSGTESAFSMELYEDSLDSVDWSEGPVKTVIADRAGRVLGLAYSDRESAGHNFTTKFLREGDGSISERFLTLHSRERGLWIKGLEKHERCPLYLEVSSGNYLTFEGMRTYDDEYRDRTGGNAILIVAGVRPGIGFCHEEYVRHRKGRRTKAYRSCFHEPVAL